MTDGKTASVPADTDGAEALTEDSLVARLAGTEDTEAITDETEIETSEETEKEFTEDPEQDGKTPEAEDETEDNTDTEDELDEIEGIDLNDPATWTEDQIETIRETLKSKAAGRIGQLTKRIKELEESLNQQRQTQPAEAPEKVESRFLKDVKTPEDLQTKSNELRKLAKDVDVLLDDNEHLDPDDSITVGDQEYTKAQLKALKREVREALDEAVPYRQHEFAQEAQRQHLKTQFDAAMANEVPELKDEDSEVAKQFQTLNDSELFKQIRERVPDAGPSLDYVLAHFCRSRFGGKPTAKKIAKKRQTPPTGAAPSGVATRPNRAGTEREKSVQQAMGRFQESGDAADLEAALAAKLTN